MVTRRNVMGPRLVLALGWVATVLITIPAAAQQSPNRTPVRKTLSTRYVPEDALVFAQFLPRTLLQNEFAKYLPIEIANAWCKENVGILPEEVLGIRVAVPMPAPSAPWFGIAIVFAADTPLSRLNPAAFDQQSPLKVGDLDCFGMRSDPSVVLHVASPRTWLIATRDYLPTLVKAARPGDQARGMPALLSTVPSEGAFQLVVDLKPLRPMMAGSIAQQTQQLPPPFSRAPELVGLFDAAWISVDLDQLDLFAPYRWTLRANSQADAQRAEQLITEMLAGARDMLVPQLLQQVQGDDAVAQATRDYIQRMSVEFTNMKLIRREGLTFRAAAVESQQVASVGVMVGLLLPAIQAAREAARRMTASNNLKQIGLAMHNHHAAFKHLPAPALTDDSGKPLLSWRVKILPFIAQQALYDRFKLEEPWDSPHNAALINEMPDTYKDPSAPTPPGHTVFKLPVGVGTPFEVAGQPVRFREFRDGLSNTVMVAETDWNEPVIWTKPEDWNVNLNAPVQGTGTIHQGGFHVLMSDGAVRFLTTEIDPTLFRAMLTHQGNEVLRE